MIARKALDRELGAVDLGAIDHAAAHGAVAHHQVLGERREPGAKARVGHFHVGGHGAGGEQFLVRHARRQVLFGAEAELHLYQRLVKARERQRHGRRKEALGNLGAIERAVRIEHVLRLLGGERDLVAGRGRTLLCHHGVLHGVGHLVIGHHAIPGIHGKRLVALHRIVFGIGGVKGAGEFVLLGVEFDVRHGFSFRNGLIDRGLV